MRGFQAWRAVLDPENPSRKPAVPWKSTGSCKKKPECDAFYRTSELQKSECCIKQSSECFQDSTTVPGAGRQLYVVMEKQWGYGKDQWVTLRRESPYVREQIGSQDVSQNKLRKHLEAFPVWSTPASFTWVKFGFKEDKPKTQLVCLDFVILLETSGQL